METNFIISGVADILKFLILKGLSYIDDALARIVIYSTPHNITEGIVLFFLIPLFVIALGDVIASIKSRQGNWILGSVLTIIFLVFIFSGLPDLIHDPLTPKEQDITYLRLKDASFFAICSVICLPLFAIIFPVIWEATEKILEYISRSPESLKTFYFIASWTFVILGVLTVVDSFHKLTVPDQLEPLYRIIQVIIHKDPVST